MAYVPGGGLPHAAVADFIAGVLNRYVGVAAAAPALVRLETDVLRWFAELIGYPDEAGGGFTSGGSMANFGGVIAARDARPGALAKGTVYVSAEAHHAVTKAARLAGFAPDRIRTVATDDRYCIDAAALEGILAADVRAGLEPCLLVGSAGTVNSGLGKRDLPPDLAPLLRGPVPHAGTHHPRPARLPGARGPGVRTVPHAAAPWHRFATGLLSR
jgi:aromatic-L-amino-acid/L-tryptophan decarboxylase